MLLTPQERDKFVAYLDQRVHDNELLISQFEKNHEIAFRVVAKNMRMKTDAYAVVANDLRGMEFSQID